MRLTVSSLAMRRFLTGPTQIAPEELLAPQVSLDYSYVVVQALAPIPPQGWRILWVPEAKRANERLERNEALGNPSRSCACKTRVLVPPGLPSSTWYGEWITGSHDNDPRRLNRIPSQ